MRGLYVQLRRQLPADPRGVPNLDLDGQLAPDGQPGTARRPDLVVVHSTEYERVGRRGSAAGDERCAGSRDRLTRDHTGRSTSSSVAITPMRVSSILVYRRRAPVSLVACNLAGEFGYRDSGEVSVRFEADDPSAWASTATGST